MELRGAVILLEVFSTPLNHPSQTVEAEGCRHLNAGSLLVYLSSRYFAYAFFSYADTMPEAGSRQVSGASEK